jgi:hypothetical protein
VRGLRFLSGLSVLPHEVSEKREQLQKSSRDAIAAIQAHAFQSPEAAVEGLTDISIQTDKAGQPDVAMDAVHSLWLVGNSASTQKNDQLKANISRNLDSIAQQASYSAVKSIAESSAKRLMPSKGD